MADRPLAPSNSNTLRTPQHRRIRRNRTARSLRGNLQKLMQIRTDNPTRQPQARPAQAGPAKSLGGPAPYSNRRRSEASRTSSGEASTLPGRAQHSDRTTAQNRTPAAAQFERPSPQLPHPARSQRREYPAARRSRREQRSASETSASSTSNRTQHGRKTTAKTSTPAAAQKTAQLRRSTKKLAPSARSWQWTQLSTRWKELR